MSEESGKVCLFKRAKKPQRGRGQRRRHESSDSNKSSASSDAGSDGGTNILIARNFFLPILMNFRKFRQKSNQVFRISQIF